MRITIILLIICWILLISLSTGIGLAVESTVSVQSYKKLNIDNICEMYVPTELRILLTKLRNNIGLILPLSCTPIQTSQLISYGALNKSIIKLFMKIAKEIALKYSRGGVVPYIEPPSVVNVADVKRVDKIQLANITCFPDSGIVSLKWLGKVAATEIGWREGLGLSISLKDIAIAYGNVKCNLTLSYVEASQRNITGTFKLYFQDCSGGTCYRDYVAQVVITLRMKEKYRKGMVKDVPLIFNVVPYRSRLLALMPILSNYINNTITLYLRMLWYGSTEKLIYVRLCAMNKANGTISCTSPAGVILRPKVETSKLLQVMLPGNATYYTFLFTAYDEYWDLLKAVSLTITKGKLKEYMNIPVGRYVRIEPVNITLYPGQVGRLYISIKKTRAISIQNVELESYNCSDTHIELFYSNGMLIVKASPFTMPGLQVCKVSLSETIKVSPLMSIIRESEHTIFLNILPLIKYEVRHVEASGCSIKVGTLLKGYGSYVINVLAMQDGRIVGEAVKELSLNTSRNEVFLVPLSKLMLSTGIVTLIMKISALLANGKKEPLYSVTVASVPVYKVVHGCLNITVRPRVLYLARGSSANITVAISSLLALSGLRVSVTPLSKYIIVRKKTPPFGVAPGKSKEIEIPLMVSSKTPLGTNIPVIVDVLSVPDNYTLSEHTIIVHVPFIIADVHVIKKTLNSRSGQTTIEAVVYNNEDVPIRNATVIFRLGSGATILYGEGCNIVTGVATCRLGELSPGRSVILWLQVKVTDRTIQNIPYSLTVYGNMKGVYQNLTAVNGYLRVIQSPVTTTTAVTAAALESKRNTTRMPASTTSSTTVHESTTGTKTRVTTIKAIAMSSRTTTTQPRVVKETITLTKIVTVVVSTTTIRPPRSAIHGAATPPINVTVEVTQTFTQPPSSANPPSATTTTIIVGIATIIAIIAAILVRRKR